MKRPYIDDAIDHVSQAGADNSSGKMVSSGSLLFVVRGMILIHSFPVAIATRDLTINQDMKALRLAVPEIAEYLLRCCNGSRDRILAKVQRSTHGTCRLASEDLANFVIPLPPFIEQRRIVAKVNQLMALCDALETQLAASQTAGEKLLAALVRGLVAA
jgi:type I restriction enzyme S subunit